MQPFQHPESIRRIHHEMVQREMHRGDREQVCRRDVPGPRGRSLMSRLRFELSRELIVLARWIEPQTRVIPDAAQH